MGQNANYCPSEFRVQIFGSNSSYPIKTDNQGQLIVKKIIEPINITQMPVFVSNKLLAVEVTSTPINIFQQDVSLLREYTFLLHNVGTVAITAVLLIAPENSGPWVVDGIPIIVEPGQAKITTSNFFLRYTAIELVKTSSAGPAGYMDLYFQGHS